MTDDIGNHLAEARTPTQKPELLAPIPEERYDLRILQSIRRIIRAADLYSRRLAGEFGVTVPQLVCLSKVVAKNGLSVKDLAQETYLSSSTVVGIVDRLEKRQLVYRERSSGDRRLVTVYPTEAGRDLTMGSPSLLQDALSDGLEKLPERERAEIADALERIVSLMEIERIDAAAILESGAELPIS